MQLMPKMSRNHGARGNPAVAARGGKLDPNLWFNNVFLHISSGPDRSDCLSVNGPIYRNLRCAAALTASYGRHDGLPDGPSRRHPRSCGDALAVTERACFTGT